jgi:signal recognition particle subunit SRP54
VPIKYLGTGEKLDAIEAFEPSRLASRILGMGDVLGLIEKAEVAFDERTAREQTEKMVSGKFDLEDFVSQLRAVKKMGPITQLLEMLPGDMGRLAKQVDPQEAERNMRMTEAIISSMTRQERHDPDLLNASRRRRIAAGSGTDVQEVNRLLKQFREAQKMMKTLQRTGGKGLGRLFG